MSLILHFIESSKINYSFSVYFAIVIIILTSIKWRKKIQKYFQKRSKLIEYAAKLPGPPLLPFIGNAMELRNPDQTLIVLSKIQRELNVPTYRFWLGPLLKIIITDPSDIEIVMTNSKASEKDDIYEETRPLVQNSLINSSGSFYRSHKKLLMPFINGHNYMTSYTKVFNEKSRILVNQIQKKFCDREQDAYDQFIAPCINDIVFETMFGIPGKAQFGENNVLMEKSEPTLAIMLQRAATVWMWPTFIFKMTRYGREFFGNIREIHEYCDKKISEKKQKISDKNEKHLEEDKFAVLDLLIQHVGETWTRQDIRDEMITLYVGSHDTMSGIGSFAVLMLAMHPNVQDKIRKEMENVIDGDYIDETKVTELKYLEMVIRETIRLFPAGPVLGRRIASDIKLTTCTLPEGCSVLMLPYATHKSSKYWNDPEKFDPERFSPENMKSRHSFSAVPFSGGPRSCPGSKFALVCLKIVIGYILRDFHLSTNMKMKDIQLHMHISTRSLTGYPITCHKVTK